MIHHFMTFEAIVQYMKENFSVGEITNTDDHMDGFDTSFKCEDPDKKVKLIWGKNYISTIKPENEIEKSVQLFLYGKNVVNYDTDSYTTTFNSDDMKLYEIFEMFGKPRLRID